jgi:hypothetical protein
MPKNVAHKLGINYAGGILVNRPILMVLQHRQILVLGSKSFVDVTRFEMPHSPLGTHLSTRYPLRQISNILKVVTWEIPESKSAVKERCQALEIRSPWRSIEPGSTLGLARFGACAATLVSFPSGVGDRRGGIPPSSERMFAEQSSHFLRAL